MSLYIDMIKTCTYLALWILLLEECFKTEARQQHASIFEEENTTGKEAVFVRSVIKKAKEMNLESVPLSTLQEMLLEYTWDEFLQDLYDQLSQYEVQIHKQKFNVKNIEDWGQDDKEEGLVIGSHNFRQFLDKVTRFFPRLEKYADLVETEASETKVEELNVVVHRSLRTIVEMIRDGNLFYLLGTVVRTSECVSIIDALSEDENISSFVILALRQLVIDSNITLQKEKNLAIISPTWNGHYSIQYNITLKGNDGKNETTPGFPGVKGENGGNFIGFGQRSTYVSLHITTNGGNGGRGADGRNGGMGRDNASNPVYGSSCNFVTKGYTTLNMNSTLFFDYRSCGGDGADGGLGGYGGSAGYAYVDIISQSMTNITVESSNGTNGQNGHGGKPGRGGATKAYIQEHCTIVQCTTTSGTFPEYIYPPGKAGKEGGTSVGMEEPNSRRRTNVLMKSVNSYRNYVESYLTDKLEKNHITSFYNRLKQVKQE